MDYLIERYLEYLSHIRDPKTVRQKRYWLNHLLRFGSLNLNFQNLVEFYKSLRDKGLKDNTIEQVIRDARKFILWVQKHYPELEASFDDETFEEIKLAKRRNLKPKEEESFTEEQLQKILDGLKYPHKWKTGSKANKEDRQSVVKESDVRLPPIAINSNQEWIC